MVNEGFRGIRVFGLVIRSGKEELITIELYGSFLKTLYSMSKTTKLKKGYKNGWGRITELFKEKLFLIGLTFVDKNGDLKEQYQTHGNVVELTNDGLFKLKRDDNSIFQMTYDKETIRKTEKDEYRERPMGIS